MKLIPFFALRDDILPILISVESDIPLKYVLTGNFLKDELKARFSEFTSADQILHLGRATARSSVGCDSFLVCQREAPIILREIAGVDGPRVCIDQLVNPDTVTFTPAGLLDDHTVLDGRFSTASGSPRSQALMKRFHAAIKKSFTKVQAFYVGPRARKLWEEGARLTSAVQSPREYDLARPKEGEGLQDLRAGAQELPMQLPQRLGVFDGHLGRELPAASSGANLLASGPAVHVAAALELDEITAIANHDAGLELFGDAGFHRGTA